MCSAARGQQACVVFFFLLFLFVFCVSRPLESRVLLLLLIVVVDDNFCDALFSIPSNQRLDPEERLERSVKQHVFFRQ